MVLIKEPVISGMSGSQWIRITGTAIMDNSATVKEAMLEAIPQLKDVYNAEEFVVYYLEDMEASLCSFTSEPIKLAN